MKYIISFVTGGTIACILFYTFLHVFLTNKKVVTINDKPNIEQTSKTIRDTTGNMIAKSNTTSDSEVKDIIDIQDNQSLSNDHQKEVLKDQEVVKTDVIPVQNLPDVYETEVDEILFNPAGKNGTYTEDQIQRIINMTDEEKTRHAIKYSGMTIEQIEKGVPVDFEYTGPDPMREISEVGTRMQSTIYGTREFFDALQDMIKVHENHPIPIMRGLAEFMKPKDANGNVITVWETYQDNISSRNEYIKNRRNSK